MPYFDFPPGRRMLREFTVFRELAVFASHRSYPQLATMSFFFFWNGVFAAVPALFPPEGQRRFPDGLG